MLTSDWISGFLVGLTLAVPSAALLWYAIPPAADLWDRLHGRR
jgi:hypothetical protein